MLYTEYKYFSNFILNLITLEKYLMLLHKQKQRKKGTQAKTHTSTIKNMFDS